MYIDLKYAIPIAWVRGAFQGHVDDVCHHPLIQVELVDVRLFRVGGERLVLHSSTRQTVSKDFGKYVKSFHASHVGG